MIDLDALDHRVADRGLPDDEGLDRSPPGGDQRG